MGGLITGKIASKYISNIPTPECLDLNEIHKYLPDGTCVVVLSGIYVNGPYSSISGLLKNSNRGANTNVIHQVVYGYNRTIYERIGISSNKNEDVQWSSWKQHL